MSATCCSSPFCMKDNNVFRWDLLFGVRWALLWLPTFDGVVGVVAHGFKESRSLRISSTTLSSHCGAPALFFLCFLEGFGLATEEEEEVLEEEDVERFFFFFFLSLLAGARS